MEHKTIEYLNRKGWYRFMKVIYILAFLLVLAGFNIFVFSNGTKEIDLERTSIRCDLKDKKEFSPQSIGLYLYDDGRTFQNGRFDYKSYFEKGNDYAIKEIIDACYSDTAPQVITDIYDTQKTVEIVNNYGLVGVKNKTQEQVNTLETDYKAYLQKTKALLGSSKVKYLDFSISMFDITPVFNYGTFLRLFFIGNAVIFMIFEAMRRMLYYIVLGKLRPRKG